MDPQTSTTAADPAARSAARRTARHVTTRTLRSIVRSAAKLAEAMKFYRELHSDPGHTCPCCEWLLAEERDHADVMDNLLTAAVVLEHTAAVIGGQLPPE